ncbi:MAG: hypothetical protein NTV86_21815 [Planctomycetota bacterium]|nr:hypothetical protein [Planctomycetota bacterium]
MRPGSEALAAAAIEAIERCRGEREFLAAIGALYREADAVIARAGCDCRACGRCCRFDRMDHRLFAGAGEIAYLLQCPPPPEGIRGPLRCPYLIEPHCRARGYRPLGCRTHFCYPPSAVQDAQDAYEPFHRRLQALHEQFSLPYAYVELTGALAALGG